ncbi:MAG: hypothetical protein EPO03_13330, partial [Porticoccaceae bacterium]
MRRPTWWSGSAKKRRRRRMPCSGYPRSASGSPLCPDRGATLPGSNSRTIPVTLGTSLVDQHETSPMTETAAIPVPVPLLDQRLTTAPDSPFGIETLRIRGIETPCWRQSFPHLRAAFAHTAQFAARDYLVYEGERHTYAEHHRQVAALAHALTTRFGIRKGDRVALAMRNYPEWPAVFWASVAIGAIIVPLNAWLTGGELAYALADSGSRLLVVDAERLASLAPHLPTLTELEATVVVRGADALPARVHAWGEVLAEPHPAELPPCALDPEDDAAIYYTSGTTGRPKGALLTHRNICANQVTGVYLRARTEFRYGRTPQPPTQQMGQLISVPLFHVTGSVAMLIGSTIQGSKLVFMRRWDPEDAIRLIERERLNSFGGVP